MLPGKAKENKMKNQKTITTHTYTCWRRQRRSSRSSMVFIAIVVADVYGRDCRYFVIYLYCTHKVRHGHEHTHRHTRARTSKSASKCYMRFFISIPIRPSTKTQRKNLHKYCKHIFANQILNCIFCSSSSEGFKIL